MNAYTMDVLSIAYDDDSKMYEYDGCSYNGLEEVLINGVVGFCGCGRPDDALKYIHDGLRLIDDLELAVSESNSFERNSSYDDWRYEVEKHFKSSEAEYFFYYVMDVLGLTEHGGSVPGWLSDKGKAFLSLTSSLFEGDDINND